jgi:hypothetical protein
MMTSQKDQIFKETRSKLAEINDSMLKRISDIANDRRTNVKARFSFSQLISDGGIVRESSSHMNSNDRLR